ncbi:hypothetical protein [Cellulosimicrobium arenosum]|uniref:Uncharacterized protein n=1 Tax=Cellulosimicrobium arenosum TaxID=2708133 RepID=A0A927GAR3_9MICO|nr:hypothetical protein [Cellulosimicrobium arenosum]MBD8079317.1 hypothetical protein [Cellulosimicrobium arenosum]
MYLPTTYLPAAPRRATASSDATRHPGARPAATDAGTSLPPSGPGLTLEWLVAHDIEAYTARRARGRVLGAARREARRGEVLRPA